MLVPMYFMIGSFGVGPRQYAAVKFLLYSLLGGLLMLVAVIALYVYSARSPVTGHHGTFLFSELVHVALSPTVQKWLFLGFFIAFAIKAPLWPFHTWLPDAAAAAPPGAAVLLVGVLDKVGTFGMLRYCFELFPSGAKYFTPLVITLSVIGILYGAIVAIGQQSMKRLIAYTSVSHFGFIALGVFVMTSQGVSGATFYMVNHGFATGALFILAGFLIARRGTDRIADFGGVQSVAPVLAGLFLVSGLAMLSLPSLDILLFYVFFEAMLVPMYFLVGGFGPRVGAARAAAVKFLLYNGGAAPAGAAALLVGVMDKVGTFGMIRYCLQLFPQASRYFTPLIIVLAVVGILYGAVVAIGQRDLKRLIAYTSISHFGFIVLGIFALTTQGQSGATLYMVNHGFSTGALFLIAGFLIVRRKSQRIADYGGVQSVAPVLAGLFLVASLAGLSLPGLSTFVSEFLVLVGTFTRYKVAASLATAGIILAAIYLLWMYQRTMTGPVRAGVANMPDLKPRELWAVGPLIALIIAMGVYPKPVLDVINPAVRHTMAQIHVTDPVPQHPAEAQKGAGP